MKTLIWIGLFIGSTIGSYIPTLWHASLLSGWSVIFGALGGLVGIWAGYKVGQNF